MMIIIMMMVVIEIEVIDTVIRLPLHHIYKIMYNMVELTVILHLSQVDIIR